MDKTVKDLEEEIKEIKERLFLSEESRRLKHCYFCGGMAHFTRDKSNHILLNHYPEKGINCPARYSQIYDSFDSAVEIWNRRFI